MKKLFLGITLLSLLLITTGCKKSIVGKWKFTDEKSEYYYIFNNDKTCSYEMKVARLDCTYEDKGEKITILYNGSDQARTFEYRFEKGNLIIVDDNGKDNIFTKEK